MSSKLEQVKEKLQFVSRAIANGYIDFDTLDELGKAVYSAIRLINEYEEQQRCIEIGGAISYRVAVFETDNL